MRVIAGKFRSRKLQSVPGRHVRPTPDRLRESLFSILAPRIDNSVFLDAYAGSGAVGIEALSRGARYVILFEKNSQALAVIRENLKSLGISDEVGVFRGRATSLLADHPADIVFLDPPYEDVNEYRESLLALSQIRCPHVIAQHPSRISMDDAYGNLTKTRVLRQGDNSLSFFEPAAGPLL